MVRAIRTVSVERGHDPRDYVLMPFGGAGPLHASDVARDLGIREILVPESPGILCAQGLIVSDLKEDFVRSRRVALDPDGLKAVGKTQRELMRDAAAWFKRERVSKADRNVELVLDMRYVGQNFELPVPAGQALAATRPLKCCRSMLFRQVFFQAHEQYYGFFNPDDPVEIVNARLTARGALSYPEPPAMDEQGADGKPTGTRLVHFSTGGPKKTRVYDRSTLATGQKISGPAIIQQLDSTTVLFPGDTLRVDSARNLLIKVSS